MVEIGKYAWQIVAGYGVTIGLLLGLVALSVLRERRIHRELREVESRRGKT